MSNILVIGHKATKKGRGRLMTKRFAAPPAYEVHEHAIRWNADRQLWECSAGCGYSRPKRENEVCPKLGYGEGYAPVIGRFDKVLDAPRGQDW